MGLSLIVGSDSLSLLSSSLSGYWFQPVAWPVAWPFPSTPSFKRRVYLPILWNW